MKKRALALAVVCTLWASAAWSQPTAVGIAAKAFPQQLTVAQLPVANGTQGLRIVTNAASSASCTVGGGSVVLLCIDSGAWTPVGAGGGAPPTGAAGGGLAGTYPNPTVATVPASALPALTGDVTSSAGSAATTVGKINGVSLAGLATGILKNTTTTGAPSIAVAGDFPTLNQSTSGNAATATALAATPTKCSAGNYPLGIDASGNAQNCTAASAGGLSNPLAAGSVGTNSLQVVQAGTGLYQPATNTLGLAANGVDVIRAETTASAVDYLDVTPGAAGSPGSVTLAAAGSDTHINVVIAPKGSSGQVVLKGTTFAFGDYLNTKPGLTVSGNSLYTTNAQGGCCTGFSTNTVNLINNNPATITGTLDGAAANPTLAVNSSGFIGLTNNAAGTSGFDAGLKRAAAGVIAFADSRTTTNGTWQAGDPGTRPTCDATTRGRYWHDQGGAGVADTIAICCKKVDDTYTWATALGACV